MNIVTWLKGVLDKMLGRTDIQQALKIAPIVSDAMRNAIELWESMYKDNAPWLADDKVHSLGLAQLISSEKARMATLEMEIKVTDKNGDIAEDSTRAGYLKNAFKSVEKQIRKQLEYGIALGGFVIKPYVVMGPDNKYQIKFTFVKANDFYPLSFSADGELTSAAFVDRIITHDKVYSKLEIHALLNNQVIIQTKAFESDYKPEQIRTGMSSILGNEISLTSIPEWANIDPTVTMNNTDTLLFAYFRSPEANTVDIDSPLGASGFSRAVSLIKEADEQYSNLLWEFEGGQLAIDVDRTALNPIRDKNGKEKSILPKLQDRLYRRNLDLGTDDLYNVFAPSLRDDSLINGLNNILMHIEDACCLARGTISQTDVTEARTATELKILKQRAYAANVDIQKELESTLGQLFKVMDIYCDLYGIVAAGEYAVAYHWDDSIIVDKDSERQIDIVDINSGLMSRVEYRMKWFGETEDQAKKSLEAINEEIVKKQECVLSMQAKYQTNETAYTEKQKEIDKRERAKESNEHTTEEQE